MAETTKCPKCGGDGFVTFERNGVSYAERCSCYDEARRRSVSDRAQVPTEYQSASFNNFNVRRGDNPMLHRALATAYIAVSGFARDFSPSTKPRGLLLAGPTGIGKTHLAVAALQALIAKGYGGVFYNYATLLQLIRAGYDPESNVPAREAYRTAMDAEILLLDDLGAHRIKDWVLDTVEEIITHRCNFGKPLIATTNLRLPDAGEKLIEPRTGPLVIDQYQHTLADRIGDRGYSRLFEMCTIINMPVTEDYRKREARVL
jgi:DNA replication protein DnaC